MRLKDCKGQSVAEYAVVLALIAIIATTVLMSIGQRSRDRLANISEVNAGFDGDPGKAAPASSGNGKAVAVSNSKPDDGDQDSESSSKSSQEDPPANEDP
jgi:Flp pilus assembly pilin Flp